MRAYELPESFTTAQAAVAGLVSTTLYRMRDRGEVDELSRGVWRWADAAPTAHESLIAVACRAPQATVCLISALALHDLIDEIPTAVDLAVARARHGRASATRRWPSTSSMRTASRWAASRWGCPRRAGAGLRPGAVGSRCAAAAAPGWR